MKRRISWANPLLYTAGIALVFLLWLFLSKTLDQSSLVFPTPDLVIARTGQFLGDPYFYTCLGESLLRTFKGFLISFGLALVLGSLSGQFRQLQLVFKPMILVLKSAPTAAFVFLFLLLSDTKTAPIWIVVLLAFPILYESVVAGFNAVPKDILWAADVDGANSFQAMVRVKLPLSAPYIILGLASSFALSFKTEIMAEIVSGLTGPGLGGAIRYYRNADPSDLTPIFAIALAAIVVVLLFDLLSYLLKRFIKVDWQ